MSTVDKFSQQVLPGANMSIPSFWPKWNPSVTNILLKAPTDPIRRNALISAFDDISIENEEIKFISTNKMNEYTTEFNKHDYTIVGVHNFTLKDLDGETVGSSAAGHFMLVTGVTENGEFIVSSWGNAYVLESASYGTINFIDVGR